jgi:hypothetical protein
VISRNRPRWLRTAAVTSIAGTLGVAAVLAGGGAASASSTKVHVTYSVTGSTYLAAPGATVTLGPGSLKSTADLLTDTLKATLTLPPATGSFNELGLVPVTATTKFINKGATKGTINDTTGAVQTTSNVILKLTNVTIGGISVPVGTSCETSSPASITVNSDPGFSIIAGGNLSGSYTIPQFQNCGLSTAIINLTLPGPGNTITLTLGSATTGK